MVDHTKKWVSILGTGVGVVAFSAAGLWAGKHWLGRGPGNLDVNLAAGNAEELRGALLALDEAKLKSDEGKKTLALTAERMRNMPFAEIMEIMRGKDLTEEQRQHLRQVRRELMMASMNQRVDEYLAAPKEQREAILDRHIDEWAKFREQMQAYEEQHKDAPDHQAEREREHGFWQRRDTQQAKERMEGGDPDRQKRMFYYWGQMRARMEARGIQQPWGPGRDAHGSQPRPRGRSEGQDDNK